MEEEEKQMDDRMGVEWIMLIYVDMDHIGGGVEEDCESE